ncbi:hypothetical protein BpHYR1_045411 [Brachionus plicatilis]|uniref:Uncharacterized protein n=1 Tax=Brachionus plicatilis TaxID=10195 RepID=A0A3M7QXX0_BRAPC|nr:hypothetical protein BpHYR1_045411 [Brachionus plicatilis]
MFRLFYRSRLFIPERKFDPCHKMSLRSIPLTNCVEQSKVLLSNRIESNECKLRRIINQVSSNVNNI